MLNNLREYRAKTSLTQEALARMVDIGVRHYQRLEAGENAPNTYTAQRLAQALNTTTEELFPSTNKKACT